MAANLGGHILNTRAVAQGAASSIQDQVAGTPDKAGKR
jgi:hypothetical protein